LPTLFGIGLQTVDKIAQNLGIPANARARVDAGLLYALSQLSDDGHVCHPQHLILAYSAEILEVESSILEDALRRQVLQREIIIEETKRILWKAK
tara:strand:- start:52 stop:336 length:285 start_codon:yes stop_codon:yes gene_type:complete